MSDKPVSILVVDDDPAKRYAIVRLLKAQGFAVTEAESGAEALVEAPRLHPDLIVLDVRLPDMSGFDVCRTLKRERATAGILVLHMSATLVHSEHRAEGLDAGADAYLTDAVESTEFLATVRALLRARNAERALRDAERRFESLVRSVDENAIFTCDSQGTITSWNEGVLRIFGYSSEGFVGRNYSSVFPAESDSSPDIEMARRQGRFIYDRWQNRTDGSRFFATGSLTAIIDDDGRIGGFVTVVRDVTARQRLEEERDELLAAEHRAREEAERVNRLKDEFLATLSHELRTPLSAILGWTQLLQTGKLSAADAREGIAIIDRNARAQAKLIEDLLDVTRIISGKLRLNLEQVDLPAVTAAAVESVQAAADAKRLQIMISATSDVSRITGDAARIQQMLLNLLSNAVKFTPEGGEIWVKLRRADHEVELAVVDNGQGIDKQFLPYVFDRFRQADASTTRIHAGLGLGLAIVRNLAELHGGSVFVHSAGPGQGATFRISLPIAHSRTGDEVQPAPPPQSVAGEMLPDLSGRSILIVEDAADTRDLLRRVIEQCGATTQTAASASEGIALFQQSVPDLIISDIGMPGEDGHTFIRRVRELEQGAVEAVPAIALTAFAQIDDRERALKSGFQVHVSKPVIPSELLAVVARLCGAPITTSSSELR